MTTDKLELIEELADKCCIYHDLHAVQKSCIGCWRRTSGCSKFTLLSKLVEEGCRLERVGEWVVAKTESAWNDAEYPYMHKCSLCGNEVPSQDLTQYCSYCGAKMTEETNNEKM